MHRPATGTPGYRGPGAPGYRHHTTRTLLITLVLALLAGCSSTLPSDGMTATAEVLVASAETPQTFQSLDGAVVSGSVTITVEIRGRLDELQVLLIGNDTPLASATVSPHTFTFDTRTVSDGEHVMVALRRVGRNNNVVARASFVVRNDAAGSPVDEAPPSGPAPLPPPPTSVTFDGPIVITRGGTYSGNWESTTSAPAVIIRTSEPVVIEHSVIRSAGHLIRAEWGHNAHVTIRNVEGYALYPARADDYPGRFLVADTYRFVRIEHSSMDGTSGIWLHASARGATAQIRYNRARNIDGRRADGRGGWTNEAYYVQFVQFDKGNALVDSEVAWNEVINEPFKSRVEDVINTYQTSGTSTSPLRIHNNYIQGAYPIDPVNGSFSGGGIMLGDAGGAYLHALRNVVVDTANYGIAIAGGEHNRIEDNDVLSCGRLPDGRWIGSQNVGIYIWDNSKPHTFGDNRGSRNRAAWVKSSTARNDWWVPDAASWTDNTALVSGSTDVCGLTADAHATWAERTVRAGIVVGPNGGALFAAAP
jgi:hypothetical protein